MKRDKRISESEMQTRIMCATHVTSGCRREQCVKHRLISLSYTSAVCLSLTVSRQTPSKQRQWCRWYYLWVEGNFERRQIIRSRVNEGEASRKQGDVMIGGDRSRTAFSLREKRSESASGAQQLHLFTRLSVRV